MVKIVINSSSSPLIMERVGDRISVDGRPLDLGRLIWSARWRLGSMDDRLHLLYEAAAESPSAAAAIDGGAYYHGPFFDGLLLALIERKVGKDLYLNMAPAGLLFGSTTFTICTFPGDVDWRDIEELLRTTGALVGTR